MNPEHIILAVQVFGVGVAVVAPVWLAHNWLNGKFEKKANKVEILEHIEKLYVNAEADRKLTRDLHDKAMERIQENQLQIIQAVTQR